MQHTYSISGMHCGSCVRKLTNALRGVAGVTDVSVTLSPPRAAVTMDHHVDTDALASAVAAVGDYTLDASNVSRAESTDDAPVESLYPLLLIVAYILGTVVLIEGFAAWSGGEASWARGMRHFMAGFFLVFSFFKLLDPPGFVSAYRGYDLLARRSATWAWAYPYVELSLGIAYLGNVLPIATNSVTLVLMIVGSAGVLQAIIDKRAIRCACLGTALNLPMTKVTFVEDLTMAAMAAAMLVMLAFGGAA